MPLKIHIKSGQQIIINGAVIENAGPRNVSLVVKNEASILRSSDILTPENAVTPASRVYYALQCMYLFPGQKDKYLRQFNELIDSYVEAAPSSRETVSAIKDYTDQEQFYYALKKAQDLIKHEHEVLAHVQQEFVEKLRDSTDSGNQRAGGGRSVGADAGGLADDRGPGDG
jgi:flagellar protein FlbT